MIDVFNPNVEWITAEWRTTYWPTEQLTHVLYRRSGETGLETAEFMLRWRYRYEMEHLLQRTGFEVEALFGNFDGVPLTDSSPEQLWIARAG